MAGESLRQSGSILVQALRQSYENLGLVVVISLVWFALAALPVGFLISFTMQVPSLVSILIVALVTVFLGGPVTASVYSVSLSLLQDDDVSLKHLWTHLHTHYRLAVQVTAAMVGIFLVLVIDIVVFMQSHIKLVQWLSVIWLYFVFFWLMMTTYSLPLVVYKPASWLKVLQRAALLALDNVTTTILVMLQVFILTIVCWFFLLPVPLYLGGAMGLVQMQALKEVLTKYDSKSGTTEADT